MPILFGSLVVFSGLCFVVYGFLCLWSKQMKLEFSRYKLSRFRSLVGALEFIGGAGLIVGLFFHPLILISSAGLSALMFLGVLTRLRIQDSLIQTLPAIFFFVLNILIFYLAIL